MLTVGEVNDETFLRKGLDHFIEIAKLLPDIDFIHIGKWSNPKGEKNTQAIEKIKEDSPQNIQYLGFVQTELLNKIYSESKVYLQLSRHEAFGVSVVEAMSYGCIPIVSNAYALPEIVGDNGTIIDEIDYDELAKKIEAIFYGFEKNNYNPNLNIYSISMRKKLFRNMLYANGV